MKTQLKAMALGVALALGAAPAAALDLGNLGGLLQGGGGGGSSGLDIGRVLSSAQQAFGEVSPEQEAVIGMEGSAVLLGAAPLVRNEAMQRYVNRVGLWVAMQSERPNLPWRFAVLDTTSVNSFAAPGGYVFITRGLLGNLRNESELAGVLAHEIVHVVEKHYLAGVKAAGFTDLGAIALGEVAANNKIQVPRQLTDGLKEMFARGLDKTDEYEADRKALALTARAGYDPFGLVSAIQTLAALNPSEADLAYMFKTHPTPGARLGELDVHIAALEVWGNQPVLADRFRRTLGAR